MSRSDPSRDPELLLIGCGNMGRALAAGYHARMPEDRLLVVDPNLDKERASLPQDGRIGFTARVEALGVVRPGVTIIAVKPQTMPALLPRLAPLPLAAGLVVSIAAGIETATIQSALTDARIVRAMPNTPAMVGAGITGLWAAPTATPADRLVCEAADRSLWVPLERDIDGVTAVSGSGPAYMFAFVEALAQAGLKAGLEHATAEHLARATLVGAAAMLNNPAASLAALKAAVRSPGGTTDAALCVFEDGNHLVHLVQDAVAAARVRAVALSGEPAGAGRRT